MMKEIITFDFETTSLDVKEAHVIEIGACRWNIQSRLLMDEDEMYVKLPPGMTIPRDIQRITGIKNEHVENRGVEAKFAIRKLLSFIGTTDIMAFNSFYDMGILREQIRRHDFQCPRIKVWDGLELAYLADSNAETHKLEKLAEKYNVSQEKSHRAVFDSRALFNLVCAYCDNLNISLENIFQFLSPVNLLSEYIVVSHNNSWLPGNAI